MGVDMSSTYSASGVTWYGYKCIDGDFSTVCHTNSATGNWIQVDLGQEEQVKVVKITNRRDGEQLRLGAYEVWLSNSDTIPASKCHEGNVGTVAKAAINPFAAACIGQARYVRIVQVGTASMNLGEVEVYGTASTSSPTKAPSEAPTKAPTPTPYCNDACSEKELAPCGSGFSGKPQQVTTGGQTYCCPAGVLECTNVALTDLPTLSPTKKTSKDATQAPMKAAQAPPPTRGTAMIVHTHTNCIRWYQSK
jgi:hypothetical protein